MYILLISGAVSALLGILLIIVGIMQSRKRISSEDEFISTDAEVVRMDYRIAVQTIKGVPLISKEYRPIIRYLTDGGKWVTSSLPYTLKISPEYPDYKKCYESGAPLNVRYDPKHPENCYYGSKRGFRIREAVYKFIVGALLIFIGCMLIKSHFYI